MRLGDWSLSWIPLRCVNLFGNGSGTDLYFPFVSPTQAWNPGAGLTAALGRGDDAVGRILTQMHHSASEVHFQRCSAHISDFRLILHSFGLRFSLWYQAVFFSPGIRLKRSHAQHVSGRRHVRGGLLSSKHDRRRQRMLERMNSLLPTCCQTANIHLQFLLTTNLRSFKWGACYIFLHVNISG